jgi:hypothetical protein
MNQETTQKLEKFYRRPSTTRLSSLVDVEEVSAAKGELLIPAVKHVNLALMLSSHSASWRDSLGTRSKVVSAGMVSLCYFGKPVRYELGNPADFAVVLFRNEALEQVREETRQCLGAGVTGATRDRRSDS